MRLGQFTAGGSDDPWAGVVLEDEIVNLHEAESRTGIYLPETLRTLVSEWEWRSKTELVVSYAQAKDIGLDSREEVEYTAPITDPQKVVAVGLNYGEHADEGNHVVPDSPVLFAKFPQSLTGTDSTVQWDSELTVAVDYEGELAVVIGKKV